MPKTKKPKTKKPKTKKPKRQPSDLPSYPPHITPGLVKAMNLVIKEGGPGRIRADEWDKISELALAWANVPTMQIDGRRTVMASAIRRGTLVTVLHILRVLLTAGSGVRIVIP